MVSCSRVLASSTPRRSPVCSGEAVGWFRLAGIRDPKALCGACLEVAGRLSLDPQRVPEHVARALERRLPAKVWAA